MPKILKAQGGCLMNVGNLWGVGPTFQLKEALFVELQNLEAQVHVILKDKDGRLSFMNSICPNSLALEWFDLSPRCSC